MTAAQPMLGPTDPAALLAWASANERATLPGAWIGGVPQAGEGAAWALTAPATGVAMGIFQGARAAQVEAAVAAARGAAAAWRDTPRAQRAALLARIADGIAAHQSALVALQQLSNGKPLAEAEIDVSDAIATFRYYQSLCADWDGFDQETLALPQPGFAAERRYVPCGVAGLILPWNFPLVTAAWKLAPALAAGCTVVVKPSEAAPLPELALANIVHAALRETGAPAGVANWVFGAADVGRALLQAPAIDKLSFTGSTAVGRHVMQAAVERFTRLSLELGGKSSLIVCADADLTQAVDIAVGGIFTNAGQMCSATSRILVHRRVYSAFVELFAAAASAMVPVTAAQAGQASYGPLIHAAQRERVLAAITRGLQDGIRLVAGGGVPAPAPSGFFVEPTVFADVPVDHPLWRDEIFGPVACVRVYDTDEEAIERANDTEYGLAATVIGADEAHAARLAGRLRAGIVWRNAPQVVFPEVGWGGFGSSGLGRELGVPGLRAFQEPQHFVHATPQR